MCRCCILETGMALEMFTQLWKLSQENIVCESSQPSCVLLFHCRSQNCMFLVATSCDLSSERVLFMLLFFLQICWTVYSSDDSEQRECTRFTFLGMLTDELYSAARRAANFGTSHELLLEIKKVAMVQFPAAKWWIEIRKNQMPPQYSGS